MRLPRRASASVVLLALGALGAGCTATPAAQTPKAVSGKAGPAFVAAFEAEMTDPMADAGYLDAIDKAVAAPDSSDSVAVVAASLHALVFELDSDPSRLAMPVAFRSREGMQRTVLRLRQAWDALRDAKSNNTAAMRGLMARALHVLALYSGETHGANVWGARTGCATAATVVGPLDSAPLGALHDPSPITTGAFQKEYPGLTPLKPKTTPVVVPGAPCLLDTHAGGGFSGMFDVVVDIKNRRAQRLSFVVTTTSAASLSVGGTHILDRPFDMGSPSVTMMGQASVGEGTARLILRVADRGDSAPVEIDVLGEDGMPVELHAPVAGDVADAKVTQPTAIAIAPSDGGKGTVEGDKGMVVEAAGLLALGQTRRAEHAIESYRASGSAAASPSPDAAPVSLLYVRAMASASDMPDARRVERTKSALDAVLKAYPNSWEAKLAETELTIRKKGVGDGVFAALSDMGISTPASDLSKLDAVELYGVIGLATEAGVDDVAERAYAELAKRAPNSPILARADASLHHRTGKEEVEAACKGGGDRSSTACFSALAATGDRAGARTELSRLRDLRGAPTYMQGAELNLALVEGDSKKAFSIYDSMPPGSRSLAEILPLLAKDRPAAEARVRRDLMTAQDGVTALAKLPILFGEPNADAKRYEGEGRALVEQDKKEKAMAGAATAVLRHVEHYGLDESGLLHTFSYDLRRVSGTTDVEQTGSSGGAAIEARGTGSTLRRRIYKKDGRVLEPDTADRSAQGGAMGGGDLSQLEQGDYVEEIATGLYIPSENGQLTIDTNDILPERTSVREAEIAFRLPENLDIPMWAHPLLGKPVVEKKQGYKFITYRVTNHGARRLEDGIPPIEQGVRVSMSTQSWANIARSIKETVLSLGDSDPFMARFAEEAAKGEDAAKSSPPAHDLATVSRVVEHVGRVLKIANGGGQISDMASAYGGGAQGQTARYMIEDHQGSRSWVIYRTLKELKFDVDIAVAETSPFSTSPDFPAHPGRFSYPLVVVHLPDGDKWIDADIEGPPLPPGRVSPELRGRNAVLPNGKIIPVAGSTETTFDDVDIKLTVDPKGTAKGSIAIKLRGRQAQSLSESFNTIVGSDRHEVLRRVVQSWMPWADVDEVKLSSAEGAYEVDIDAQVSVHGFASPDGRDGKSFVLAGLEPTRGGTLAQMYASKGGRQSALAIESPVQYHVKRRLELAPGSKVTREPSKIEVKSGFLTGERTTKVESGAGPVVLSEEFNLNVPTGTIAADRYDAFVEDVHAIDSGFLAGIRIKVNP